MKSITGFFSLGPVLAAAALAATASLAPVRAENAAALAATCTAPAELTRLAHPLKRFSQRLAGGLPVKIVAIGSSSTAGAGASAPSMTYPSRLAVELKELFPRADITVVNHGINGEESRDMLARFEHDVFAESPDLVIWQVGSNSVLRDRPLEEANGPVRAGLKLLHDAGIEVVLMNPQYSPRVFTKHDVNGMVDLLEVTAKQDNVDLFERYAVMRYWQLTEGMPFGTFIAPDDLHMNDWGYGCLAKLLAGSLHDAATRATVTATAVAPAKR
jgi:lysophospholipase L1-like esterase